MILRNLEICIKVFENFSCFTCFSLFLYKLFLSKLRKIIYFVYKYIYILVYYVMFISINFVYFVKLFRFAWGIKHLWLCKNQRQDPPRSVLECWSDFCNRSCYNEMWLVVKEGYKKFCQNHRESWRNLKEMGSQWIYIQIFLFKYFCLKRLLEKLWKEQNKNCFLCCINTNYFIAN